MGCVNTSRVRPSLLRLQYQLNYKQYIHKQYGAKYKKNKITTERNVMVYFQPGEWMRMMFIQESDAGILGKKKSECSYQESNLRPSDY